MAGRGGGRLPSVWQVLGRRSSRIHTRNTNGSISRILVLSPASSHNANVESQVTKKPCVLQMIDCQLKLVRFAYRTMRAKHFSSFLLQRWNCLTVSKTESSSTCRFMFTAKILNHSTDWCTLVFYTEIKLRHYSFFVKECTDFVGTFNSSSVTETQSQAKVNHWSQYDVINSGHISLEERRNKIVMEL